MFELELDRFLLEKGTILDVRTPSEFIQGRIPNAVNLPLFSDEERVKIGTLYKHVGVQEAIDLGYHLVLPRIEELVETARGHLQLSGVAKLHCWRGGMRSRSVAELFQKLSIPSFTLKGGYKSFRRWAIQLLEKIPHYPFKIYLLGGMTGSGKTAILRLLKNRGEQVLDLEDIARHRGSSFGCLNGEEVPTNEQFENEIAFQWHNFSAHRPIWIEDESRSLGQCKIPDSLFSAMQHAPLFIIERPQEHRLERLYRDYATIKKEHLIVATERIKKKLGAERTKKVCQCIQEGNLKEAIGMTLGYYDSTYQYSLTKRDQKTYRINDSLSDLEWAELLLSCKSSIFLQKQQLHEEHDREV